MVFEKVILGIAIFIFFKVISRYTPASFGSFPQLIASFSAAFAIANVVLPNAHALDKEITQIEQHISEINHKMDNLARQQRNLRFVPQATVLEGKDDLAITVSAKPNPYFRHRSKLHFYLPGAYDIRGASGGDLLLKELLQLLEEYNTKYIDNPELQFSIFIKGEADSSPAKGARYNGDLGETVKESYFFKGGYGQKSRRIRTLEKGKTRLENIDYALLRAISLKKELMPYLLDNDNVTFKIAASINPRKGGVYRGLEVSIVFNNLKTVRKQDYNILEKGIAGVEDKLF